MENGDQEQEDLKCFEQNSACEKIMPHITAVPEIPKIMDDVTDDAYVRGLDATFGTYFTDYIVGITCFFYGLSLCIATRTVKIIIDNNSCLSSEIRDVTGNEKHRTISKNLETHFRDIYKLMQSISASFFVCTLMHVVGGLVHHQVRYITPHSPLCVYDHGLNETDIGSSSLIICMDEFEALRPQLKGWYFIWKMANILAASFAVSIFLVLFRTILCDFLYFPQILNSTADDSRHKALISVLQDIPERCAERRFESILRKYSKFVIGGLLLLLGTQILFQGWEAVAYTVTYSDSVSQTEILTDADMNALAARSKEKFRNLWSVIVPSIILAFSFLAYAIFLTYLLIMNLQKSNRKGKDKIVDPNVVLTPNTSSKALLNHSKDNSFLSESQKTTQKIFKTTFPVPLIRCISIWGIFCSGALEAMLAGVCGKNDAFDCPLPAQFNHNALYHVILTFAMALWCIAEHAHCRQEIEAMTRLRSCLLG